MSERIWCQAIGNYCKRRIFHGQCGTPDMFLHEVCNEAIKEIRDYLNDHADSNKLREVGAGVVVEDIKAVDQNTVLGRVLVDKKTSEQIIIQSGNIILDEK